MRVVTVVGARPQFIKAWPVSEALREAGIEEYLVHSGQHYDDAMSRVFFDELGLPRPACDLGIGSGPHGQQTGRMLMALEPILLDLAPDCVIVYGDTNTTLAATLAACKQHLPVAHVEAGLRSWNRTMPEEHNRIVADHCADLLFCPTSNSVVNLTREGITRGVHLVGDVMFDALRHFGALARERSTVLDEFRVEAGNYYLATLHRPQNADDPGRLTTILRALMALDAPVVFPVHPRTRTRLAAEPAVMSALSASKVRLTDPLGYLDMLMLEQCARGILTDSGGVQKEAFLFGVPCVTIRSETEWTETLGAGWNVLVEPSVEAIAAAATAPRPGEPPATALFGDGKASAKIAAHLEEFHGSPPGPLPSDGRRPA